MINKIAFVFRFDVFLVSLKVLYASLILYTNFIIIFDLRKTAFALTLIHVQILVSAYHMHEYISYLHVLKRNRL